MREATLYTRAGCRLCARAEEALRGHADTGALRLSVVDVDTDPALADRYGLRVPVVVVDGTEVAEYEVDESALAAYLGAPGAAAVPAGAGSAGPGAAAPTAGAGRAAGPGPGAATGVAGPAGGSDGRTPLRAVWLLAVVLHLGLAVFPFSATGLVAPLGGVLAVYAIWALLLAVLMRRFRAPSWWLLGVPVAAGLAWIGILLFGDTVLGWTA